MDSEDLGVWLWKTTIPGNTLQNCTFTSQYSEQKHLSKATRPGWTQTHGAHSSWHQIVTDVCSRWEPVPKLMASIQLGLGNGMTRSFPAWGRTHLLPQQKLIWGLGLKCQSVEQKAVFLGSRYWGYTPFGPGFGDKEPVTHGVIFKVLPHYLNQQHKHEMTRSQVLFPQ